MKINNVLTPKTLAKRLGITEDTLLSWKPLGIPIVKIGKFSYIIEESFLKWLKTKENAQDASGREIGKTK